MRLGFLTDATGEWIDFAAGTGFQVLELRGHPGRGFDVGEMTDGQAADRIAAIRDRGVDVSSILVPGNHLDPDTVNRKAANKRMRRAIRIAGKTGVPLVTTCAWGDADKTVDENLPAYKKVYRQYAKACRDNGVRLAIENCPHVRAYPIRIGSISYSPDAYAKMFDAVPDEEIGMEFDPSHFYWLGVEPADVVAEFGDRIYIVHAKDTEVLPDVLHRVTIYGDGWWRYRVPGWGDIKWPDVFRALADVGYDGDLVIEHEDPVFDGPRRAEGLRLGLKFLEQFVAG